MRRNPFTVWCGCVLLLAGLLTGSRAEAQATRGIISGTVHDKSGAVLPGVTVTATNQDTGIARNVVSSAEGIYRIPALEPGMYTVRVELSGFQTIENKGIDVKTAQEVVLDVALAVATLSEVIQVSADASVITLNKANPTIGITATSRQAVELPLSAGRDINRLALLSPTAYMAPGSTGMSVGGNRARNNNFTIDGSDNNDISVTLSTVPIVPEAVSEFHLEVNPYNVEFGRSSGGQFNVITRSGTNVLHGDLWEYYRGSSLNALDNVEKRNSLKKPAFFVRNQFGGGAGGPIVRNKVFFYGLFQEDRNRNAPLGSNVRIPTQAGYAALASVPLGANQTAASRQAVLGQIAFLQDFYPLNPTFTSVTNTSVNGVPIETGLTNFLIKQPNTTHNLFGRTDFQISPSDNVTARVIMNKPLDSNVASNTGFGERFAAAQDVFDQNASGSYTRVFSSALLNEGRFSYIHRNLQFPENDPTSPSATINGGFFTIGGASNFPQGRTQDSFQFADTLTNQLGRHGLKMGADIRYITLDNIAAFDSKGTFTFDNFQAYMNNLAVSYVQALQTASFKAKQWQSFMFVQDDFKVTPTFTVNMGLRYELSTTPFGFFGATDAQSLGALVPGPVKKDTNNWAPRAGATWSPAPSGGVMKKLFGDGDAVVRGGFGVTYDILFYNLLTVDAANYPRVVVPRIDNAQNLYPTVQPVTGAAAFDPLAGYVNTPEDAQNPRTTFWNLSIQRQLGPSYTVEVGYLGNIGRNGINQLQANPATLTDAQAATVATTLVTTSIPSVQARRDVPQFGSRTLIATTSNSEYHGGYVKVDKRFAHGLQFGGSYTFSKYMSDNDESLGVGAITTGSPQIPQDYRNIDAEWSLSAFDRRHRGVLNWIYELPHYKRGWLENTAGGWQFSGVFQAQSGQPFTIVTGVDSNGNGGGGDRPNVLAGGTITPDPVTGNLRTFTTSNLFFTPRGTNGLPLAFALGNGNLGRNTLRAPAFYNWDLSVSKRVRLFGTHAFLLRADFLNAFNQDNYGIPVNSLNNVAFGTNTNNWGNRSVTLNAKYTF
jgi:outer membrane receptor protein involved in Fe transport